ncbi:MAG: thiamine phosphate synthase [Candidatus Latescibacteria bacterium]|nr:thiamine phosphate synthase [Candidatus Latescibacterota bacterium]
MNYFDKNIFRLFDANLNRAQEGIRVIEETVRMLFNNENHVRSLKELRHEILDIVKSQKNLTNILIEARDSEYDVLRDGESQSERTRPDINAVIQANSSRAQEALRTLEEYSKLIYPHLSGRFKKIRFCLYDIEKSIIMQFITRNKLTPENLKLYVIIDHEYLNESDDLTLITQSVIERGAGIVEYKNTRTSDDEFLKYAEKVCKVCKENNKTIIIHDRLDCALILGADGVNLSQSGIPVTECRKITYSGFIIGYRGSINNLSDFRIQNEADFLMIAIEGNTANNKDIIRSAVKKLIVDVSTPVLVMGLFSGEILNILIKLGVAGIILKPGKK